MGARELVCRTNLARKRWDLTQQSGICLRKQTVVFKRREGRKPHSGMLALRSASWQGPGFFRRLTFLMATSDDADFLAELGQSGRQGDCKKALNCQDNRAATAADCAERRIGVQDWTNDRPEPKQFSTVNFEH